MKISLVLITFTTMLLGCQVWQDKPADIPSIRQVSVNGTNLRYLEQGEGTPVIFLHGGVSDRRVWETQREVVAKGYRYIAIDQRYFGTAPWSDDGAQFSQATHVADLAAFISMLNSGPVYIVGQSYGTTIALAMAVQHPALVRGLFVNEPPLPSVVTDPLDQQVIDEERKTLVPVIAAVKAGNTINATRLFVDWVNGHPGAFDDLPPALKTMHLDNARTLPLQLNPPLSPLTCSQLAEIKAPVMITKGALTRPFFRVIVNAAHRCMPASRLMTISGARHGAPWQASVLFNEALLAFLSRNWNP